MSPHPRVRVKAIALIRRPADGAILVGTDTDPASGRMFERPLGGNVEFGETTVETIRRELLEELGLEVTVGELRSVIENRFVYSGAPGHEILFVYEATFTDDAPYRTERLPFVEGSHIGTVGWRQLDAVEPDLVPPELLGLL